MSSPISIHKNGRSIEPGTVKTCVYTIDFFGENSSHVVPSFSLSNLICIFSEYETDFLSAARPWSWKYYLFFYLFIFEENNIKWSLVYQWEGMVP